MSEQEVPAGCAPIDEDLSAWLDGELDASGAALVRDHVEGCARCTARVVALRAVDDELHAFVARAPSEPERERLARLRARVAAAQAELQPLPARATESDLRPDSASAAAPPAAPRRRRRWLPAAAAAAAAALLAGLVLPGLLEHFTTVTETELALRDDAPPAPIPVARPPAPGPAAPAASREQLVAETAPPPSGRVGASVPEEERAPLADAGAPATAPADARAAARDPARPRAKAAAPAQDAPDDLDLAIALAALEGVAPADLATVERLDAIERLAPAGAASEAR